MTTINEAVKTIHTALDRMRREYPRALRYRQAETHRARLINSDEYVRSRPVLRCLGKTTVDEHGTVTFTYRKSDS